MVYHRAGIKNPGWRADKEIMEETRRRVLLDTNIVLDYLDANQRFTEDAEKVFDLATKRKEGSHDSSTGSDSYD